MSHYRSNRRDLSFNLFELLGREEILGTGLFEDVDRDVAEALLDEVDHLATSKLATSFADGDGNGGLYDPSTRTVSLPKAFVRSYQAYQDSGFTTLGLPSELGGQPAPASLQWAANELVLGANPAVYMYASGPKFSQLLWVNGTPEQQRIGQIILERQWGGTMVLTEPDAGSDVGAGRTRALPQPDGSWHLEGVKRFITSAEHDLSENIVHFVLARPYGVDNAGGPGTKGLSMFIVPKFHFDHASGELTGQRNGVYATNLEHKMGLKVSATCELTFGGGDVPAVGWLLGEVHNGIAQMFEVIEHARMMVGSKAIATLSTGYLNALDYAKHRIQGPDLMRAGDKSAPRVPITSHPDVRRSLITQKAFVEGMRSLVLFAATYQDRLLLAQAAGTTDAEAARVNDLLLPIVKGYGSERSWTLLGTESLQTLGGSGFLSDYPLEQYVRDAKIDTLYEGTTAIQGQDLFFRKIVRDRGQALGHLSGLMQEFVASEAGNGQLKEERALLQQGLEDSQAIVASMLGHLQTAAPQLTGGDPRNIYLVGLNTTRLLMALGDVICAWLLLRSAEIALQQLNTAQPDNERLFYEGKVAAARWFARTVLPKLSAERAIAESSDLGLMDLPSDAF
ncbi:MAG TPA: acyl-CoA dehydrogenase [Propionibacteriaceae bacterium]|nr:acyl-CoA dehydrogenase [Propionibacteriaceae bacterium]